MNMNILRPKNSLNKAFLKVRPHRTEIEKFKSNLIQLLDRCDDKETEEFHKNLVGDFLKRTYYEGKYFINTKQDNDQVIHNRKEPDSSVGVIIEAKKPTNKGEMVSKIDLNRKAFHQLILYFLRERITHRNVEIKFLVATNINEWFVFDAQLFEKLFITKKLVKQFKDFENGSLAGTSTKFFYNHVAKPFVEELDQEIEFTYFDIRDYEKPIRNEDKKDDRKIISLFKLFSPEHLLKLPFANDSNSLDRKFYNELLHIIGLAETEKKKGSKKIITRKKPEERDSGSLLENTIVQLESKDVLNNLPNPSKFGGTIEERHFNLGLELCITWVNRILFLKLLESQLLAYHKDDKTYKFLSFDRLKNYDDLDNLFFQALAQKPENRTEDAKKAFQKVPYLNSSLFEPSDIERVALFIGNLDTKTLQIDQKTVLRDKSGKTVKGEMDTLEYLLKFLDSYDFSGEGSEDIQEDENKTLINASVLGLIFEKINGYKDGSFFTPGFITMHMCRETIRAAVVQKFNDVKEWNCKSFEELEENLEPHHREEANSIINSIKICDPAVGSGHFLVSALNEIISIKSTLGILQDREGKRLKNYTVEVVNDELSVTDYEGDFFKYSPLNKESQRVQEALFHEKELIIENCLFGVDINPNSVRICRLRLWIELLKNAYYVNENELETLPNIDINIKCGNSLISRFDLSFDLNEVLKKTNITMHQYREAVKTYMNAESKEQKREMRNLIKQIKKDFTSNFYTTSKENKDLARYRGQLINLQTANIDLFGTKLSKSRVAIETKRLKKLIKKQEEKVNDLVNNKIYQGAFEWRFEFPEVLGDDGAYIGFDVIIGNPPYAVVEKKRNTSLEPYKDILDYAKITKKYKEVEIGKQNLYRLFIKLAHSLGKENCKFHYIIPLTLMGDNSLYTTRKFIFKGFKDIQLRCFPQKDNALKRIFEDAKQSTLLISAQKETNKFDLDKKLMIYTYPGKSFDDPHKFYETTPREIMTIDDFRFNIPLVSQEEWVILKKLHVNGVFRKETSIKVRRGEINQTIYRKYITSDTTKSDLIKGVEVSQYRINTTLSQGEKEYFDEEEYLKAGKRNLHSKQRRIATQRITGVDEKLRIVATIVDPIAHFADSTNSVETYGRYSLEAILGILNSSLFQWRFKKTSSNNNVSTTELESMPFKYDKEIFDDLQLAVKKLLLNKGRDADLRNQINSLTYKLYDLTPEEVHIVEEL